MISEVRSAVAAAAVIFTASGGSDGGDGSGNDVAVLACSYNLHPAACCICMLHAVLLQLQ